jgi:3,4-dihydroxyphthalate decarboxylase
MRGHGITTAGASIEEATLTAIKLNEVAEINYRASLLGTPEPISQEEIDVLAGKASGKSKAMHSASSWRYYCRLLDE